MWVNAVRVNAVKSILKGKRSLQAHHSCIVTHVYPCGACNIHIGSAMSCMCMHLCEGCESSAMWCQTIQPFHDVLILGNGTYWWKC